MKKLCAWMLAWMAMLSLVGCGQKQAAVETQAALPNKWGVTLETENVTANGLTLVCHQTGGEAAELNTGSFYAIERLEGGQWTTVEYAPQEYEVAWTSEAWLIAKEGTTKWEINWTWLYGQLPAGEYRMAKPISNFRGPGDYDTETIYATFCIK